MQTSRFDVQGMTYRGCTGKAQRALSKLDDVNHVDVRLRRVKRALSPEIAALSMSCTSALVAVNARMLKRTKLAGIKKAKPKIAPAAAASAPARAPA
ncbi:MAG: cation transport ATPase [Gammaproteobacteria bacterium]|jgi:cation transport ATPase